MFCKSLQDKNVESSTDNGDLVCEVSEGGLKTLLEPFELRSRGSDRLGLKNQL